MSSHAEMPELLSSIISWEKEIAKEVPYLETPTGYFLQFKPNDNGAYNCSPCDSIMFASTGCDGVHYSLLTDFGQTKDLSQAPVICVSPMDFGNCIRIVANNLFEFFSLSLQGHEDFLFNNFESQAAYEQFLQEREHAEHSEYFDYSKWKQQKEIVRERAVKQFNLKQIDSPYQYVKQLREKRAASIVLTTADRLGIMPLQPREAGVQRRTHPWSNLELSCYSWNDAWDEVIAFVNSAEIETLLAFVRDCQHYYVDHVRLIRQLQDRLEQLGFHSEAERLMHCMLQQW
ncbi:hypothetical protein J40TS1_17310 [Paenibacillus montaniterrae]|uniref:SMI1/KNR4 family protein n=1 Tax=Paenibacillus montaniterrae TaxID=429341 RepID=A0A920CYJ2_9BACL|nr:hypothetical protein [Paenibacillus montaniterrae]GIP16089.1 hypothetical protein J40TS1_17310 [Paenibacillus montaniterrae]